MKGHKLSSIMLLLVLSGVTVMGARCIRLPRPVQPPQPVIPPQMPVSYEPTAVPSLQGLEPIAVYPLQGSEPTPIPPQAMSGGYRVVNTTIFTTTLYSSEAYKFVLGPCAMDGGYLVDVTPLQASTNGTHIEQQILPEFDGEMWVDVLSLLLPEPADPLPVRIELASTVGWPIAFQQTLTINPGDWAGFIIQESEVAAGYVIEINPLSTGEFGDRVEKALVQPEFQPSIWWDVLRLQIPVTQSVLTAEVLVYQTPAEAQVATTFELEAEPGVWVGVALGESRDHAAYIVEVTPLINRDNQVERYTVQPEFDGRTWNDVVRVIIPSNRPPTTLQVTVYRIALGDG
jgi:hypothetical protein